MADPRFIGTLSLSPYIESVNPSPYTGYDATIAMVVDRDFGFIDSNRKEWWVRKGDITDGANIPWIAKYIIGGGFQQPYMPAAVLHDIYCRSKVWTWQDTDNMFYEAMILNGTILPKALTMWLAVYTFGPHWTMPPNQNVLPFKTIVK